MVKPRGPTDIHGHKNQTVPLVGSTRSPHVPETKKKRKGQMLRYGIMRSIDVDGNRTRKWAEVNI
ncbi:hypothetical protein LINGRAHAP2_LOCUS21164 [Linum grandiflorum]